MNDKTIKFYKFFNDTPIEYRWEMNGQESDVLAFIYLWDLERFSRMLSPRLYEEGIELRLKDRYVVAVWMKDIFYMEDIELELVFGPSTIN